MFQSKIVQNQDSGSRFFIISSMGLTKYCKNIQKQTQICTSGPIKDSIWNKISIKYNTSESRYFERTYFKNLF